MPCGCGGGSGAAGAAGATGTAGAAGVPAPILSGVLAKQYATDTNQVPNSSGLSPSAPSVDASLAAAPNFAFFSGPFWVVVAFIAAVAVVVHGAGKKNE